MSEQRTTEQIRQHYEVETELAARLRQASREERRSLYTALYDEMLRRVPSHPLLTRKLSPEFRTRQVAERISYLKKFLTPETVFLEIGPGDCAVSFEIARRVRQVYAVDVSEEITRQVTMPTNFQLFISDGSSIPVPPGSVQAAFSDQLMEHLHPDDALEQLRNIHRALTPGGVYICNTPSRLTGPHDVSGYFDREARGFHLAEYTVEELSRLFRAVGFSEVKVLTVLRGRSFQLPVFPLVALEKLLARLPYDLRKSCAGSFPFSSLLGVQLIGVK